MVAPLGLVELQLAPDLEVVEHPAALAGMEQAARGFRQRVGGAGRVVDRQRIGRAFEQGQGRGEADVGGFRLAFPGKLAHLRERVAQLGRGRLDVAPRILRLGGGGGVAHRPDPPVARARIGHLPAAVPAQRAPVIGLGGHRPQAAAAGEPGRDPVGDRLAGDHLFVLPGEPEAHPLGARPGELVEPGGRGFGHRGARRLALAALGGDLETDRAAAGKRALGGEPAHRVVGVGEPVIGRDDQGCKLCDFAVQGGLAGLYPLW